MITPITIPETDRIMLAKFAALCRATAESGCVPDPTAHKADILDCFTVERRPQIVVLWFNKPSHSTDIVAEPFSQANFDNYLSGASGFFKRIEEAIHA